MTGQPVILTLQLDGVSYEFFEDARQKYFPSAINYIGAHLTLFHQLPGREFEVVLRCVADICKRTTPLTLTVSALRKLGRGVVYDIASPELLAMRSQLANDFGEWLIAQDKQKFRPHITVQNKVSPEQARALYDHLSSDFSPFEVKGEGIQLWFYEGGRGRRGTWRPAGAVPFQS